MKSKWTKYKTQKDKKIKAIIVEQLLPLKEPILRHTVEPTFMKNIKAYWKIQCGLHNRGNNMRPNNSHPKLSTEPI